MRFCMMLLVWVLSTGAAQAVTVDEHLRPIVVPQWRTIGADPCKDNANCTLEWALARAEETHVFPERVANAFARQIEEGVQPFPSEICRGERFAMSFGRAGEPHFIPHMRAAFTEVECTATVEWRHYDAVTERTYRLFIVEACANIGAGILDFPTLVPPVAVPVPQPQLVLATLLPVHGTLLPGCILCGGGSGGSHNPDPDDPVVIIVPEPNPEEPYTPPHTTPDPPDIGVVPLPAGVVLLITGLGLLSLLRHRRA